MQPGSKGLGCLRRASLAANILGMFALADAGAVFGTTWTVSGCTNFPAVGSLRYALNHAVDGDTVDMTGLVCSTIDLTQSGTTAAPLPIPYGTVTVLGPGMDKLTITGNNAVRIFYSTGVANPTNFILEDLTLAEGNAAYDSLTGGDGGCIETLTGAVTLDRVEVSSCAAAGRGGGVHAATVTVDHSKLIVNNAKGDGGAISAVVADLTSSLVGGNNAAGNGGGIRGTFVTLTDSTVSLNNAFSPSSHPSGGGVFTQDNLTVTRSTVHNNYARGAGGGIDVYSASPSGFTTTVVNSTISGNVATSVGGIYSDSGHIKFYNSTIAFNYSVHDSTQFAAGVATGTAYGDIDLTLYSTLISNNMGGQTERDFSLFQAFTPYTFAIHGSQNFVRASNLASSVFSFQGACPLLGPLKDNGGPTWTHALWSTSPAIDAGNNVYSPTLLYDQRGPPYSRVVHGTADIGAYEVPAEMIFNSGFEGC